MIDKGHMEKIPIYDANDGWYIPHHRVYNSMKPGKIRVVFDCSAQSKGASLNDHLLKGPDLTNTMTGVLFRKEHIAIQCDVEGMFHQFHVNEEHRKYVQLLWWDDDNTDCEPSDYRMTVHLFGATSSPGCANFAFRQLATDYEHCHGAIAVDFVRNSFYVDDGLTSVATVDEAVNLIKKSKDLCEEGALNLHKFASNSKEVLMSIPPEDCAKGISDVDIMCDSLPVERTLGVNWCIVSDTFGFRIHLKDQPFVRRGILSTINSIYDPLGFIAPVLLLGKQILQETCKDQLDWDEPLPDDIRAKWEKWRCQLWQLDDLQVSRCFKPPDFTNVKCVELHHFADASNSGYGQSSYLSFIDEANHVHCAFVMGKARIAPLKSVTIPRLELTAAVVSVRVSEFLQRELQYENITEYFWTDSKIVLGYIANDSKRFHIFVANRVQYIREHTQPSQWRHVQSSNNPADVASRGINVSDLSESMWLTGPEFLWKESLPSNDCNDETQISADDPEIRKVKVHVVTKTAETFDLGRIEHISKWNRAKKAIAICLKLKAKLLNKLSQCNKGVGVNRSLLDDIDVSDLQRAELKIIKLVQRESFENEFTILKPKKELDDQERPVMRDDRKLLKDQKKFLKASTNLSRLDPYIDSDGVLRVGGRIKNSNLSFSFKHPVILPRKHHVTDMIVRHFHEKLGHQGRGMTVNEIRSNGLWIIGCSSDVSHLISKCGMCRKLRSSTLDQKMADLPEDRMQEAPPFTYCGVDMFGPFLVKEGRKGVKRYGALFTCLGCRAIHIETTNSMSTDSFINALRRFITVRGPIRQLRSDQGTNFVGAQNELHGIDSKRVSDFLHQQNCDYFSFVMNVPSASHMGGVWKRQIRTVRSVISSLMNQASEQLDDEGLRTLMCERWKREYIQTLQVRQKWKRPRRVAQVGDIVLLKDDNLPRNLWRLCRIYEVYKSKDNLVRKVKIAIGDPSLSHDGKRMNTVTYLERPIHKLILLLESELEVPKNCDV
ncbi:uncharacterized protein LOC124258605 [Haliotis rubra]|uniref:uncharacterized protein LOC124258605 n=1 Tax=Haliotis rubra TaxID=36100 RepID=UPI001EE58511|nr:uncharacterized protein LOC124258605 [Haliotis rubra]